MKTRKNYRKTTPSCRIPQWASDQLPFAAVLANRFLGNDPVCAIVGGLMASQVARLKLPDPPSAPRVLIVGPTSSGKSFLVEEALKLVNLPAVTINMGLVTGEGYKGVNLTDGINSLIKGSDLKTAQRSSVIVLDEVDKILRRGRSDDWISQLQYSTLPVLNGDPILLPADEYGSPQGTFRTTNSLVFAMGVFPEIHPRRWGNILSAQKALAEYGFCYEWISRFTHFIYLSPIAPKQLELFVERESQRISSVYQTRDYIPQLRPSELQAIVRTTSKSPYGLRASRALIHHALYAHAKKNAIREMV